MELMPPLANYNSPLHMLLHDSYYDEYKGVICQVAVVEGTFRKEYKISCAATSQTYEVLDVGIMHPELKPTGVLLTGQVGYVVWFLRMPLVDSMNQHSASKLPNKVQESSAELSRADQGKKKIKESKFGNRVSVSSFEQKYLIDFERRLPVYDGMEALYTAGVLPFTSKEFMITLVEEDEGSGTIRYVI
ncbi:hypothetical protein RHSIM_Rhsim03G0269400 [Rhododendron simsii]|uniref:Uncharacterized protein n=1 Tax=Rhododendron simsii TaxID=118357 RepID=A0A834LUX4_RHOSS|nr:hypothetical protein RHSIM_Rhsim03G0269400 [Rhododendron simsii]